MIAPFIRERALAGDRCLGELAECVACRLRFYVDRYDDEEVAALYRDYRGPGYLAQRHRHEPWYTRSINDAIGGAEETRKRNQRLASFLVDCGVLPAARSVLDWGGDRGQFMPASFEERYVYDISGVDPEPGVRPLTTEELSSREYDLVLLAHVLEHASDPRALLRQVLAVPCKHLYVEVPFEPFRVHRIHCSASYRRWVASASRWRIYPALALMTIVCRVGLRWLPPFGVLQQHEHLSFFTMESLVRLIETAGCRVVAARPHRAAGAGGRVEALGIVAARQR